jgi:hypothetical protein
MKERKDILDQLQEDEKRNILLQMLRNNMDATRRCRAMTETILGRAAYIHLAEEELSDYGLDDDEDEDEYPEDEEEDCDDLCPKDDCACVACTEEKEEA